MKIKIIENEIEHESECLNSWYDCGNSHYSVIKYDYNNKTITILESDRELTSLERRALKTILQNYKSRQLKFIVALNNESNWDDCFLDLRGLKDRFIESKLGISVH